MSVVQLSEARTARMTRKTQGIETVWSRYQNEWLPVMVAGWMALQGSLAAHMGTPSSSSESLYTYPPHNTIAVWRLGKGVVRSAVELNLAGVLSLDDSVFDSGSRALRELDCLEQIHAGDNNVTSNPRSRRYLLQVLGDATCLYRVEINRGEGLESLVYPVHRPSEPDGGLETFAAFASTIDLDEVERQWAAHTNTEIARMATVVGLLEHPEPQRAG